MPTPILTTKLYIPQPRSKIVLRPRLNGRLNEGLRRKLTLVSAPAGFGKTTLVSAWLADCAQPAAWLSLDEGDNDPARFFAYFVAALQKLMPNGGTGILGALQAPQPPPIESLLTMLLNDLVAIPHDFILVLDDYHVLDAKPIDHALAFLLERLPPQMHLVIITREDPQLPLARLRARDQLTELRVADLRFTLDEAAGFLRQTMGLKLLVEEVAALETRTEGWVVGLQLAAISMRGLPDTAQFIQSFTGSHHFVLDYLLEEVLQKQPADIQVFLLRTSLLTRLCGPLCDALLATPAGAGQKTLEYLEQSNMFIIPLDHERRWYRYHHLFGDLLRQRLQQSLAAATGDATLSLEALHTRASEWYEDNGLEVDAFQHAVAAHDVARAERLIEGKGMPLHFRGVVMPVLNWLEALPTATLDAHPSLWMAYASTLLVTGQATRVEPKLQAAEAALQRLAPSDQTQDLIGRLAAIRATLATGYNQVEAIIAQSRRALEYLHPNNVAFRTSTAWKLGFAYHLQGERVAARQAYTEVITTGQATGNVVFTLMAALGLGHLQELDNQLQLAAQAYQRVLDALGDQLLAFACEAQLGLARIHYEWSDLVAANRYVQQCLQLARQIEATDRAVAGEVFLARLKLVEGDLIGANALLTTTHQTVRTLKSLTRLPEWVAAQTAALLRQDKLLEAEQFVQAHPLPLCQARVKLAQGNTVAALTLLEQTRQQAEAKGWADERLKAMVLQVVALDSHGNKDQAMQLLNEVLALTEPESFVRTFVDEGAPMAALLTKIDITHEDGRAYVRKLLAAFETQAVVQSSTAAVQSPAQPSPQIPPASAPHASLVEPLSQRELEVLQLIAQGLSNREISEKLFLALDTVKGHNRKIFDKLQVQRRTEAVALARKLGLLS